MSNYSSSKFIEDVNTPWYKVFKLIPEKKTVLDIGCSSGNFGIELISKKNCIVDGVEIDPNDFELAKKKLRDVYSFNIEAGAPDEIAKRYDIVYYGDVIEHLINPVKALANTKKLLKSGGKVVFSIPNMAHISVRLMLLKGNFEYGNTGLLDNTHLHYYTREEIERVFNEAGYTLETLDWVKRDIPASIIDEKLQELGLKAEKSFYEMSQSQDAAAYQFIGIAKPVDSPKKMKRPKVSPKTNEMGRHITKLNREHKAEIKRIIAHYENLIENQKRDYEQLLQPNNYLRGMVKKAGKKVFKRNMND